VKPGVGSGPVPAADSGNERRRTLVALVSAAILSLVVWGVVLVFNLR
jgi:hypothetical protein